MIEQVLEFMVDNAEQTLGICLIVGITICIVTLVVCHHIVILFQGYPPVYLRELEDEEIENV